MKKLLERIGTTIFFGGVLIVIIWVCNRKLEDNDFYESKIGSKVIIQKDTLVIINCSIADNTYTLSNGTKMNFKLLEKIKTLE